MTELGWELLFDRGDEAIVKLFLNEVDGTATETSAHDPGTCHITLAGKFIEEIKFGAADFIKLAHSEVSLVHHLADRLIISSLKGVADVKNPLDLSDDIFGPQEILLGNLLADFLQPNSLGV